MDSTGLTHQVRFMLFNPNLKTSCKMSFVHAQAYAYSPLPSKDAIRLLRIISCDQGLIRCSLDIAELHSSPVYDCLSYTWGDPLYHGFSAPQHIRITTDERIFPIE